MYPTFLLSPPSSPSRPRVRPLFNLQISTTVSQKRKRKQNQTHQFFFLYENENLKHRNGYYYYRKKIENLGLEEQEEGGFVCNSVFKVLFLFWVIVKNRKRETWG